MELTARAWHLERAAGLAVVAAALALAGSSALQSASSLTQLSGAAALSQAETSGIDIGSVIETVQHHVAPSKSNPSTLVARDRLYQAEFSAEGLSLSLHGSRFALETAAAGAKPWRGRLNVAERELRPGLTERVTALESRLEWDFVLARPPLEAGDLRIDARIDAKGPPRRVRNGWRWPVGNDRFVHIGVLVVKDADGHKLYRALPTAAGRRVSLTVPAWVLEGASYPLTIDPVISPEYPVSDPVPGRESSQAAQPPRPL